MSDEAPTGAAPTGSKPKLGNTAMRFASALPFIPLLLYLMYLGPGWAFEILILLTVAVAAAELMRMGLPGLPGMRIWGVLTSIGLCAVLTMDLPTFAVPLFALVMVVGSMLAGLIHPDPIDTALSRTGWLLGGPLYVAPTLGTLVLLQALPHGGSWVLLAMFLSWLSDTTAYFAGKHFGRRKLYPKLSPKKTIEGALGGLVGSTLGATVTSFFLIPELPLFDAVALAIVGGALGQCGDLFESLLKRSARVKDSGRLLPGHGGILDRVDALMFTSSATWVYAAFLFPGS